MCLLHTYGIVWAQPPQCCCLCVRRQMMCATQMFVCMCVGACVCCVNKRRTDDDRANNRRIEWIKLNWVTKSFPLRCLGDVDADDVPPVQWALKEKIYSGAFLRCGKIRTRARTWVEAKVGEIVYMVEHISRNSPAKIHIQIYI